MSSLSHVAPVAIFAFNRPVHLAKMLESLESNIELNETVIYFFCDGPRGDLDRQSVAETIEVMRNFTHPNKEIITRDKNLGLSDSIKKGVQHVLSKHDRLVVLEDDLTLSRHFLNYMFCHLEKYKDDSDVAQISGYMYNHNHNKANGTTFLPLTTSWGWGGWRRTLDFMQEHDDLAKEKLTSLSWIKQFDLDYRYPFAAMLDSRIKKKNKSWAIWLYFNTFHNNKLVLYPQKTLVNNNGFDGSGTHCTKAEIVETEVSRTPIEIAIQQKKIDTALLNSIAENLYSSRNLKQKIFDFSQRIKVRVQNEF